MLKEPIEPVKEPSVPRKLDTPKYVLFTILFGIIFIYFAAALALYHPVRAYEAALFVTITTAPVWFFGGRFLAKKLVDMNFSISETKVEFSTYIAVFMLVMGTVYIVNGEFDSSPEQTCEATVSSKHLKTRHGTRTPEVYIHPCTKAIIPFIDLDDEEEVYSSHEEFDAVEVGVTTATVIYKSGRYGMPWKVKSTINLPAFSSEDH